MPRKNYMGLYETYERTTMFSKIKNLDPNTKMLIAATAAHIAIWTTVVVIAKKNDQSI